MKTLLEKELSPLALCGLYRIYPLLELHHAKDKRFYMLIRTDSKKIVQDMMTKKRVISYLEKRAWIYNKEINPII